MLGRDELLKRMEGGLNRSGRIVRAILQNVPKDFHAVPDTRSDFFFQHGLNTNIGNSMDCLDELVVVVLLRELQEEVEYVIDLRTGKMRDKLTDNFPHLMNQGFVLIALRSVP